MSRAEEERIAGELGLELGLDFVDRKFKLDGVTPVPLTP